MLVIMTKLLTWNHALAIYGDPELERSMVMFDVPTELEVGAIPKRIYCNRDLVVPLTHALTLVVKRGLADKIRTWDGCFCVRRKRTGSSLSLHSWGLAVDLNASWNRMGKKSAQDSALVACFKESGFDWGGDWSRPDAMHFQLAERHEKPV
jgi:hypothetical protein